MAPDITPDPAIELKLISRATTSHQNIAMSEFFRLTLPESILHQTDPDAPQKATPPRYPSFQSTPDDESEDILDKLVASPFPRAPGQGPRPLETATKIEPGEEQADQVGGGEPESQEPVSVDSFEQTICRFQPHRVAITREYWRGFLASGSKDVTLLKKSILVDQWLISDIAQDSASAGTKVSAEEVELVESLAWKYVSLFDFSKDVSDLHRAVGNFNVLLSARAPKTGGRPRILQALMKCHRAIFDSTSDKAHLLRALDSGKLCLALPSCPPDTREATLWAVMDCYLLLIRTDNDAPTTKNAAAVQIYLLLEPYTQIHTRGSNPSTFRPLSDYIEQWKIPAPTVQRLALLLYDHYERHPNALFSLAEPAPSEYVLSLAIELMRAAIDRMHAMPAAQATPEERMWWGTNLALMLTQRHRRKLNTESEADLHEALWLLASAEEKSRSLPPGKRALVLKKFADQLSLLYNPREPDSLSNLDKAIEFSTQAVGIARKILRKDDPEYMLKPGDIETGGEILEWTVELERLLIKKLQFHIDMNQEEGCQLVEEKIQEQLDDVLQSSERIKESKQWLGRAQAVLTRAWLLYVRHRSNRVGEPTTTTGTASTTPTGGTLLDRAIEQGLQALALVSELTGGANSLVAANIHDALSIFYLARYDSRGDIDDLTRAGKYANKSVKRMGQDPNCIATLHLYLRACHSFAQILVQQFRVTGASADLVAAVEYEKRAVNGANADRLLKANYQVTLSQYLELRFEILREAGSEDPSLVEEAKITLKEGIGAVWTAFDVVDRYGNQMMRLASRYSLCSWYVEAYVYTERSPEWKGLLDRAIQLAEEAVTGRDFAGGDKLCILSTLAEAYSLSPDPGALEAAVKYAGMAVAECPTTHFQRAELQYELGRLLSLKYKDSLEENVAKVIAPLKACLDKEDAPPSFRLKATVLAAGVLQKVRDWPNLYAFTKKAMNLMPLLCIKALPQRDQQSALKDISGLGSIAAAAALEVGKTPGEALTLLEYGRDVIASNRFDTRVDVTNLRATHPKLAERFDAIREDLDPAGVGVRMNLRADSRYAGFGQSQGELSEITSKLFTVNDRYRRLLVEIRAQEGFEKFLARPDESNLIEAAGADGAIVVVNVAGWRCDALILRKGRPVELCLLTKLREEEVDGYLRDGMRSTLKINAPINISDMATLEWLWEDIAEPVLTFLGHTAAPPGPAGDPMSKLDAFCKTAPRVWWVMTRNTSRLPIHASISASPGPGLTRHRVVDRVISSYTTSIKALLFSRQQLSVRIASNTTRGKSALLCAVPETTYDGTAGLRPLSQAASEATQIRTILASPEGKMRVKCWVDPPAEAQAVLSAITPPSVPTPSVFHFAGHGKSSPIDPSLSAIYLVDEPLTVDRLLRARVYTAAPILAYLSACSTGTTTLLPDEGVHIMSGFVSAGFMNVLGTLWDTDDLVSCAVAVGVYRRWVETGMQADGLARALHWAVGRVKMDRGRREVLMQAVKTENWACFVHMGV